MAITTTVTWADLRSAYDDELNDLRDAHDELQAKATEEYGDGALDRPLPDDPDAVPADQQDLFVFQTVAQQYQQAAETIQKRQHMLERLEDEYGEGAFELKLLSGTETMEIEAELRMEASNRNVSPEVVNVKRNALTVDKATVDAPEGVPREDGSPVPSECPNALTLSLFDQINRFNSAGATDFRAEGFGDPSPAPTPPVESSATPTSASEPSKPSDRIDET